LLGNWIEGVGVMAWQVEGPGVRLPLRRTFLYPLGFRRSRAEGKR